MVLRIKFSLLDLQAAITDGWVDGLLQGKQGMYIYAELGKEQDYIPSAKDDPKTSYKLFQNCAVYLGKIQQSR